MDYKSSFFPQLFGAMVVNTIDPMAEGQVQFYTPLITEPGTQVKDLPWARPISPFGGFDDSGVNWVPPAGSKVALLCENGDKNQIYYLGTFFPSGGRGIAPKEGQRQPDPNNSRNDVWGVTIPEYDNIWEGSRDGYNLGSNDGDQVKMPWNTETYMTKDWDTQKDFYKNPNYNKLITYPYIYGFKTPEKHYLKFVDGDHKCNHRWRRVELMTGCTQGILFKDDHLHPCQWPFNGGNGNDLSACHSDVDDTLSNKTEAFEKTDCENFKKADSVDDPSLNFANPYYKRKEEMRFYQAPSAFSSYGKNACTLPQSGIHMQSLARHMWVMDDSVDQPQGEPRWNREFDFGCNNVFKGKMFGKSTTGHVVEWNDEEDDTLIRGENNGIKIQSATGNRILLRDHTLGTKESPEKAGDKRGIFIQSTADHVLEFHDEGNRQFGLPRQAGAQPIAKADAAYVLLRSGYGMQLRMDDSTDQENTTNQYLQLLAPQKSNTERGPHQMVFQEAPEGPGLVMLRSGGVYYRSSYDSAIEVVGDENNPTPADKFVQVTGKYIVNSEDYYFNHNNLTIFQAEEYIFLFAGRDCPLPDDASAAGQNANANAMENAMIAADSNAQGQPNQFPLKKGPCIYPVVVGKDPFVCPFTNFIHYGIMSDPSDPTHTKLLHNSLSDRVFASASQGEAEKEEEGVIDG